MKNYIALFLLIINLKVFSFNVLFHAKNDTLIDNNNTINAHYSFRDSTASILLSTNPVFLKNWENDHLFAYKTMNFSDIGDTITLQLLNNDKDDFKLNWYGSISSSYGWRWGRKHEGLDIPLHTGDSVVSTFDGIVRYAKFTSSGYGNCIVIRHLNGLETLYGHLSKIEVSENQFVKSGKLIGLGGSTGRSTGPHLHFEIRLYDYSFNPAKIIDINNRKLINSTMIFSKKELFTEHFYTEPTVPATSKKQITNKSKATYKSKVSNSKKATTSSTNLKKPTQKSVTKKTDPKKVIPKKPVPNKPVLKKPVPKKTVPKKTNVVPPKKSTQIKSKN
jgi:hypothetical protein